MIKKFFSGWFSSKAETKFVDEAKAGEPREAKIVDPLDPLARRTPSAFPETPAAQLRPVTDFTVFDGLAGDGAPRKMAVGDAAVVAMDDSTGGDSGMALKGMAWYGVPEMLASWYGSQGFIGYQQCSILAQHWLVDKACSMAGEDATRNGWTLQGINGEDLDQANHDQIVSADKKFKLKQNLVEFNRFKNIFGIRVAIFKVKSEDPLYYEKPFNIDGCGRDCYEGISQVDPYWMTPVLNSSGASDPAAIGFYEPQYWVINGKKYHISHLAIARGPQPSDILKPTYIFGGISLVQRIYERVYAAERTANEAPLMAMSKRTMAIHADLDKIMANQCEFEERLALWIKYRDNHGVKVLGTEEAMEQFDTTMSDFDSIIMNQYQIVAAIARVPSTKLLGTSPKGFNATGEFESKSYHEELESVNEHVMMPMLERHYDLLSRSLGMETGILVTCNPVDSVSTKERAELNKQKADTGIELINAGVISPDEERERIIDDEHSGYDRLRDTTNAHQEPGMSPENLANLEKAGAATTAAENPGAGGSLPTPPGTAPDIAEGASPGTLEALIPVLLQGVVSNKKADPTQALLAILLAKAMGGQQTAQPAANDEPSVKPGTKGSVLRSVQSADDGEVVRPISLAKMPKMRLNGLNLVIENPRGTVRVGTDINGKEWASTMPDHYGFIKGYKGADGDDVDCFIGHDLRADKVYVIVQKDPETEEFDEYKCMIGYPDEMCAEGAYHMAYSDDWKGFDGFLPPMNWDEFQAWLESGEPEREPSTARSMDEFKESEHPRANNGEFGAGGGGAAPKAKAPPKAMVAKTAATQAKAAQAKAAAPQAAPKKARGEASAHLVAAGPDRNAWPQHIRDLVLPPAWTNVRISPDPKADLLAIGKDAKDRAQYIYSAKYRAGQDAAKFERVKEMADQYTMIKGQIAQDRKSKNEKTRATADSMSVILSMGIRPGSDRDTKAEKKAYGASNMEARHVVEKDGKVYLDFTGKKGVDLSLPVNDKSVANMLKERAKGGGDRKLFPGVNERTLLQYAHGIGEGDFKTKDFRTMVGTSHAMDAMKKITPPTNQKEYKAAVKQVAVHVSQILGNTPTVALQSYINPFVFSQWKANLNGPA
jgi:phage-related protein (TIGR01555 family)